MITWTNKKKEEVTKLVDIYFNNYPYGESIFQQDKAQEDGLQLLSEIYDIVQPFKPVDGKPESCPWDNNFGDHTIF